MPKALKALILGSVTGLLGLVVALSPPGQGMEENLGLGLLFKLRGTRKPPPEVIVVNIDKATSERLGLPDRPADWPRSLHARLVESLKRAGAEVIVFDVTFDRERDGDDDRLFAEAVRKARNVVFCEFLRREVFPYESGGGRLDMEVLVPPIPVLARHAAALAPFPLPKLPFRVNQYWTFKTSAGDTPTLPVAAFQVYAQEVYDEFVDLLDRASAAGSLEAAPPWEELVDSGGLVDFMLRVRGLFRADPSLAERMLAELEALVPQPEPRERRMLRSLIMMYGGPDSSYLNFYGPPGTIPTVPYHRVLRMESEGGAKGLDFRGKAVFVGRSETRSYLQKDGFYTVFSRSDGLDLNGVEIAATAFANISEDMHVRPLPLPVLFVLVLLYGMFLGVAARLLPSVAALVVTAAVNAVYLCFALYQFRAAGTWYPLTVPFLVQSPLSLVGALAWKYVDVARERQAIRKALSYYLPGDVVERLVRNIGDGGAGSRVVYGTCLYTDLEQYTKLSESMEPEELGRFVNTYYETIFAPVERHGGIVSNVVADSMLALWVSVVPDDGQKERACHAALEIREAVAGFGRTPDGMQVSTRIGLHSGKLFLGNIGSSYHYEYRPVGDIVNTATRIEGLNKLLGTRLLVSEEIIASLEGFLLRELGWFLLYGKSRPIKVHELICTAEEATAEKKDLCHRFAGALAAFRRRSWDEAAERLEGIIGIHGEDGPSRYYLGLIERFRVDPPGESWNGVVSVEKK